jgi:hypothetical protein
MPADSRPRDIRDRPARHEYEWLCPLTQPARSRCRGPAALGVRPRTAAPRAKSRSRLPADTRLHPAEL